MGHTCVTQRVNLLIVIKPNLKGSSTSKCCVFLTHSCKFQLKSDVNSPQAAQILIQLFGVTGSHALVGASENAFFLARCHATRSSTSYHLSRLRLCLVQTSWLMRYMIFKLLKIRPLRPLPNVMVDSVSITNIHAGSHCGGMALSWRHLCRQFIKRHLIY